MAERPIAEQIATATADVCRIATLVDANITSLSAAVLTLRKLAAEAASGEAPPEATPPARSLVAARRARVLEAVPIGRDIRTQVLLEKLQVDRNVLQSDLDALLHARVIKRTGWGRWERVTELVPVWSGRDTLLALDESTN